MDRSRRIAFLLIAAALASPARADFSLAIPNNATRSATLTVADEIHRYRARIPAGAAIKLAVKSAKGAPAVAVRFLSPTGAVIASGEGTKLALAAGVAAASGVHTLEVTNAPGAPSGAYTVTCSWKTPKSATGVVTLAPNATGAFAFSADAGAAAAVTVKPAKGSAAVPALTELAFGDDAPEVLGGGVSQTIPLGATGDYLVRFGAGPAGGAVSVRVKLKPRAVAKTKLTLAPGGVVPGADVLASSVIGKAGGIVDAPSGPIGGASVEIEPGALAANTSILLGAAPTVASVGRSATGGPAVFVGPEGLTFAQGTSATITIPFDVTAFPGGAAEVRVFTRDAEGAISPVTNPAVDFANGLVSFSVSHFSSFQAARDFAVAEQQRLVSGPEAETSSLGEAVALAGDNAYATRFNATAGRREVKTFRRSAGAFAPEGSLSVTPQASDGYGSALAASGDRLLVGAQFRDTQFTSRAGSAFVFARDVTGGWTMESELALPGGNSDDRVGVSVDLDGDTAIVGAPGDREAAAFAGAARVFVRDGTSGVWSLQQKLFAPTQGPAAQFGTRVALDGYLAAVSETGTQLVHVFRRSGTTWTRVGQIAAPDLTDFSELASGDIDIDGGVIAVLASPPPGGSALALLRFYDDQGSQFPETARFTIADLAAPGESTTKGFGLANVALSGDLALLGTPLRATAPSGSATPLGDAGNAFALQRVGGTWRLAARLRGTEGDAHPLVPGGRFGTVALDGAAGLVGSSLESAIAPQSGAVDVFDFGQ